MTVLIFNYLGLSNETELITQHLIIHTNKSIYIYKYVTSQIQKLPTFTPSSAKVEAIAAPIPALAPVTIATLPIQRSMAAAVIENVWRNNSVLWSVIVFTNLDETITHVYRSYEFYRKMNI